MSALLALVLATTVPQEELARRIAQLGADSIEDREEAMRTIEDFGLEALPILEKEAARAADPETRERIRLLIKSVPKAVALAKVFGRTKRASGAFRGAPLREVADALGGAVGEKIRLADLDLALPVTLELKDATMWEALDRLAKAVDARYEYQKEGVVFFKGASPSFPVAYHGQFRISIVEIKRIDYRAPGTAESVALVVVEIQYQRNVSPAGDKYGSGFNSIVRIDRLVDEKGEDAVVRAPWGPGSLASRRPFGLQQSFTVNGKAKTLTLEGAATARFSRQDREIELPLEGDARETTAGDATLKVGGYTLGAARITLSIEGKVPAVPGAPPPPDRLKRVWIAADDGRRAEGQRTRGSYGHDSFRQDVEFAPPAFKPSKAVFEWITEIHALDLPVLLERVKVPGAP